MRPQLRLYTSIKIVLIIENIVIIKNTYNETYSRIITVAKLKTVQASVLKLFKPVTEFKAVDGFVHVRKNGAHKWRVYKVSGVERLCCQCRSEGPALRVQLKEAVAK